MKSFTDIEQSKRLAEILPLESADMYWMHVKREGFNDWWKVETIQGAFKPRSMDIPCWSLAALLEVLQEYDLTKFVETECSFLCYCKGGDKLVYSPTPVDACVKMIELIAKEKDISRRRNDYGKNSD